MRTALGLLASLLAQGAPQDSLDPALTRFRKEPETFLADASVLPPLRVSVPVKRLPWPFPGKLRDQNPFNNYQKPTDDSIHAGLDLLQPVGTEARAVDEGIVAGIATNYPEWKTHHMIVVAAEKDGSEGWSYTHLDPSTYSVKPGDRVRRGQVLGKVCDFSIGKNDAPDHLHLNYVRFRRTASGEIDPASLVSLVDPLLFFDADDDAAPFLAEPFRFLKGGTLEEFPRGKDEVAEVSGAVDVAVGIADGVSSAGGWNWGVPVVTLEIRGEKAKPWRKLVLDQRGEIAAPRACRALFVPGKDAKAWLEGLDPFPVVHFTLVTHSDGDGVLEAADALQRWDTAERDAAGKPRFPDGTYQVTVRAWDLKGNRSERTAKARVANP